MTARSGRMVIVALVAVLVVATGIATIRARAAERERVARSDAIRAFHDPRDPRGWVETFETDQSQPLDAYDARWTPLFGRLLVHPGLGAAIGDPGDEDGGDDYAFRLADTPTGDVTIVLDGWWDGHGAIGVQGAVQRDPPHRFYEAALWRSRLNLIYFAGPGPADFEVLAESAAGDMAAGHYRIVLRMTRIVGAWVLEATLRNAGDDSVRVTLRAVDGRLGEGGQGLGLLSYGTRSYVTGIAVRAE